MRILYVEDDESNYRLVERILEAEGHEVVRACSGEDGVRDVEASPPGFVLMDLVLPGIDGIETARRMREIPGFYGTQVVAVTAKAMDDDRRRAAAEGFAGFVVKPYRVETLRNEVRELTGTKVGQGASQEPSCDAAGNVRRRPTDGARGCPADGGGQPRAMYGGRRT